VKIAADIGGRIGKRLKNRQVLDAGTQRALLVACLLRRGLRRCCLGRRCGRGLLLWRRF
jgi:hypothetical protein